MAHRRNDDADGEAFERYLESLENGPFTTDFKRLTSAGLELPHPDSLNDEQLARKLWEVIHALARLRTFITSTDHLSDRELYTRLWTDTLHHEVPEADFSTTRTTTRGANGSRISRSTFFLPGRSVRTIAIATCRSLTTNPTVFTDSRAAVDRVPEGPQAVDEQAARLAEIVRSRSVAAPAAHASAKGVVSALPSSH